MSVRIASYVPGETPLLCWKHHRMDKALFHSMVEPNVDSKTVTQPTKVTFARSPMSLAARLCSKNLG